MLSVLLESEILIPRPSRVLKSVVAGTLNSLAGISNPFSKGFEFSNDLEHDSTDPFSRDTFLFSGSFWYDFGCSNWIFLLGSVLWFKEFSNGFFF